MAATTDVPPEQAGAAAPADLPEREWELAERERELACLWNDVQHLRDHLRYRQANPAYQAIVVHLLGLVPLEPEFWLRPLWHQPDRDVLMQQQIAALDQAIPWLERYRAVLRELREGRT
jgi:hypothetical protein